MPLHQKLIMGVLGLLALPVGVLAGDLNPPAGAVLPTNRVTLNNQAISLPHTIDAPGSYVLTSNFLATGAGQGFIIDADHVTLDLNGFTISGIPGTTHGIEVNAGKRHIVVRNGAIRDWGGVGVLCNAEGSRLEDLACVTNGSIGMRVTNHTSVIRCAINDNTTVGIFGGNDNLVESCIVQGNGSVGIDLDNRCVVIDCSTWSNEYGIVVGFGSLVQGCDAHDQRFGGIVALAGSLVIDCAANMNPLQGLDLREGSAAIGCTTILNGEFGIRLNQPGATAINCLASMNDVSGILMFRETVAIGNTCNENVDAGIDAPFQRVLVESNTTNQNACGIRLSMLNSLEGLVIGNRASKNTALNYDIQAGNAWGPIVNIVGAGDIGFVAGADHSLANFEY